ncbi:MAG: penicillin-binding protein 2 [Anaerolineales bacterium]|nr:MAG: penicillin-binding protein 2 [Anaerolineales bacterium]
MPREHMWRYLVMAGFFAIFGALILYKTYSIQTSPQAEVFLRQGEFYSRERGIIQPPRGIIYDRNGNILAGNRTVYEIGVDLASVRDPHAIALALSALVGADYNTVLERASIPASPTSVYVVLASYVLPEKVNLLKSYDVTREAEPMDSTRCSNDPALYALRCEAQLARSYPERDLASNLLGFVNRESLGYFGVEQQYQSLLAGEPESIWIPVAPTQVQARPEVPAGASLVLTIDREIQAMVEDTLDAHIARTGAESGTAIVMDPKTGELLAMASTPRMDLNEFQNYGDIYTNEVPYNRAVGEIYEPGSIFKVITAAAALDQGVVTPETEYEDRGVYTIGGITVRNWNNRAWGLQTVQGCMQHSLNVCLAWMGEKLGQEKFYEYIDRFGFGHQTGVDLAGEQSGTVKRPGDPNWYLADLGANTFGQGIAVTPIQMVMSVSAFVNDGQMVIPHIVKAVIQDGSQYNVSTQYAGQPISAETARTMTEMLATSLEGESSLAMVSGYRLAGKTGTAQIPVPTGYEENQTNTSFIGWGPVENPRFIVFVWLERPETSTWASEVASPLFADIVERLVVLQGIPPNYQNIGTVSNSGAGGQQ